MKIGQPKLLKEGVKEVGCLRLRYASQQEFKDSISFWGASGEVAFKKCPSRAFVMLKFSEVKKP